MSSAHWVEIYSSAQAKWTQIYGGTTLNLGSLTTSLAPALDPGTLTFLINTPQVYFDMETPLEAEVAPALTVAGTMSYLIAGPMALGALTASLTPALTPTVFQLGGLTLFTPNILQEPSLAPALTVAATIASRFDFQLGILQASFAPTLTAGANLGMGLFIPFNLGLLAAEFTPTIYADGVFDITQRLEWATDAPLSMDDWTPDGTLIS